MLLKYRTEWCCGHRTGGQSECDRTLAGGDGTRGLTGSQWRVSCWQMLRMAVQTLHFFVPNVLWN